ncbi:hypothetical protein [Bradyrhizobium sp. 186]|uniref:hypothetical protein n=1 Tax=Bradyrhizobium sp. 186 TaxID=2782654 RepID=UPI0020014A33|nr:hypothetical protein [Bradyrhizobium sp. 186]
MQRRTLLAAALGKNRFFVTQITNPAYLVPIPAKHVTVIFEVCHLSGAERAAFLDAYGRAHPGRLRAPHREARTRTISVTVPDLGDDMKNRALEQLIVDFAAQQAATIRFGREPAPHDLTRTWLTSKLGHGMRDFARTQ